MISQAAPPKPGRQAQKPSRQTPFPEQFLVQYTGDLAVAACFRPAALGLADGDREMDGDMVTDEDVDLLTPEGMGLSVADGEIGEGVARMSMDGDGLDERDLGLSREQSSPIA